MNGPSMVDRASGAVGRLEGQLADYRAKLAAHRAAPADPFEEAEYMRWLDGDRMTAAQISATEAALAAAREGLTRVKAEAGLAALLAARAKTARDTEKLAREFPGADRLAVQLAEFLARVEANRCEVERINEELDEHGGLTTPNLNAEGKTVGVIMSRRGGFERLANAESLARNVQGRGFISLGSQAFIPALHGGHPHWKPLEARAPMAGIRL